MQVPRIGNGLAVSSKVQHFFGNQAEIRRRVLLLATKQLSPAFTTESIEDEKFTPYFEMGQRCKWFIIMTMLTMFVVRTVTAERLPNVYAALGLPVFCPLKGLS